MKNKRSQIRLASITLFVLGLSLGMALFGGTVWSDMEAAFYFSSFKTADEGLKTLSCPAIINADETGLVTASFSNQVGKAVEPLYRVEISDPGIQTARKVEMRPISIRPQRKQSPGRSPPMT